MGYEDGIPNGKNCYKFHSKPDGHRGAAKQCYKDQGQIAMPLTKSENDLLAEYLSEKSSSQSLIALYKSRSGEYKFNMRTKISYSNWQPGRPKSKGCVVLHIKAKDKSKFKTWEDVDCKKKVPYTCMKEKQG